MPLRPSHAARRNGGGTLDAVPEPEALRPRRRVRGGERDAAEPRGKRAAPALRECSWVSSQGHDKAERFASAAKVDVKSALTSRPSLRRVSGTSNSLLSGLRRGRLWNSTRGSADGEACEFAGLHLIPEFISEDEQPMGSGNRRPRSPGGKSKAATHSSSRSTSSPAAALLPILAARRSHFTPAA